ncbi:MAG: response regulator [Pseudomonadota bacterium]
MVDAVLTPKRVFLVEDEPNIIEAIRFILKRDGWDVRAHSDGSTAADVVASNGADVVILDAMLPGRSGFEILKDLRSRPETASTPVLMLTAKGQVKDRELAEAHGASAFMTKPFANSEVLATVRALAG